MSENRIIKLEKLLPEKLRDKPLFDKLLRLLDYVIQNYYQNDYEAIRGAYNVFTNYEIISRVLADETLEKYLGLATEKQADLIWLLNLVQKLRGTKRGLKFLFRIIGLDSVEISDRKDDPDIQPCEVDIDVGHVSALDTTQIMEIVNSYLHICMVKHIEIATEIDIDCKMVMGASACFSIYV